MTTVPTSGKVWTGNDIRETFLRFFESKGHRRVRSSSLVPHGDPTLLFTNAGMNQFKDVFLGLEKRDYNRATTAQKCVRAGGKHNDLENVGFTKRHHTFFEMMGNFSFGDYFKKDAIAYAWELVTSPQWFGLDKSKLYTTVFGGAEFPATPAPPSAAGHSERSEESLFGRSSAITLGVDEEAKQFWIDQRIPPERVVPIPGLKDNFWAMGDTGPCGPCSEIFYDMGPAASEENHADCKFPCECGRYVEIWNLVFMQFNRDSTGTLTPLPKPCVDTGMGLERTAAVLEGVISNYDTDLFIPLLKRAAELCGIDKEKEEQLEEGRGGAASLRVIADHARAATFLVADGVVPGNGKREYVLRRIIRRAVWHGRLLGNDRPFLSELTSTVVENMEGAYPDLAEPGTRNRVLMLVEAEERRFAHTLKSTFPLLEADIERIRHDVDALKQSGRYNETLKEQLALVADLRLRSRELWTQRSSDAKPQFSAAEQVEFLNRGIPSGWVALVPATFGLAQGAIDTQHGRDHNDAARPTSFFLGERAFVLSSTFGLPLDFIQNAVQDAGIYFDADGFESALEAERKRARASWKGSPKEAASPAFSKIAERIQTEKDFYTSTQANDVRIVAIITAGGANQGYKGGPVNELKPGTQGDVVLDRTVIYADSGGQTADTGAFYDPSGSQVLAEITGAYYPLPSLIAHRIIAKETVRVGDRIRVVADAERRDRIKRNHSGTHLIHAALRDILGPHVRQAGSLNLPDRLRFDFVHFGNVGSDQLRDIEQQVNDEIRHNTQVETDITSLDNALASGALAFFGDKYPDSNVRVVTIPDERAPRGFYSKELCGGTHVHRIGDIGVLKIIGEQSVAAGVRRIEAVTGIGALEHYQQQAQILTKVASQLNVGEDAVLSTVEELSQTVKQLEKELESQKRKGALSNLDDLAARAQTIKGTKLVSEEVANVDREGLRQLVDSLRQKLGSGVVVLGMPEDDKVVLIAGVTKDLTAKVHAGKLIQALAPKVGGKGGGRPDLAEAGGKDTSQLKSALQSVPSLIEPLL